MDPVYCEVVQRVKATLEVDEQRRMSLSDLTLSPSLHVPLNTPTEAPAAGSDQVGEPSACQRYIKKRIMFVEEVEIMDTFEDAESRSSDPSATFLHLNNNVKREICRELNEFKQREMPIHLLSQKNTVFH